MTEELRSRDESIPITLSLDEGDLAEDGVLLLREAAAHLDFLSVQAAPADSGLFPEPLEAPLPPFLGSLTQWLGGKDVLFSGFGIPTEPVLPSAPAYEPPIAERLVSEERAAGFFSSALDRLREAGTMGAMVSFFSDFDMALWQMPPLDADVLARHMGLYRSDRSPKDFLPVLTQHGSLERCPFPEEPPSWIDISGEEYEEDPKMHLQRLYGNYRDYHADD
jgi:hypothetical protein